MGRFFFTPGCLTPSLFNDDSVFEALKGSGIEEKKVPDYSIAGCQEPLIMGKDNGNTTNTWLNLPKILELTLNDGHSLITGEKIASFVEPVSPLERVGHSASGSTKIWKASSAKWKRRQTARPARCPICPFRSSPP